MSVIGIDLGNDTCIIGMAARGGIDIILNENSNRKNPTLVSFQGKQRFMGESAASIARSNFKNTVREVKRLIGRTWGSPELMADLKRVPFKTTQHPETGGVGIEVEYDDTTKVFTPEQIVACMLTKLIAIAKAANNGIDVADTVMAIPGWYTDAMRSSMLSACSVAGVNCLRLIHEHTATALAYGIYKSAKGEFHEKDPEYVLFIDLGHSSFSAAVVTFVQGTLTVKSAAYDSALGGRDMDWAVAQHAADEFKAKTGKDARTKPKAMLKLLDSAEKAKKQLSPVGVTDAPMNIECLWEDLDFNGRLSLEQFEKLIKPLVQRMDAPVMKALSEAGVTKEQLSCVEIVGGATRVPLVKSHLSELLGRDKSAINFGLSCTLNADESIARGCALQCAMLSKRFKVKEFAVVEAVPYPISLSWEGNAGMNGDSMATGDDGDDDMAQAAAPASGSSLKIFDKGEETPRVRRVNFVRGKSFTVTAAYDPTATLPAGSGSRIGTFKVDVPDGSGQSKIRVNVKHDIHGMFSVQSAEMMKEKEPAPATDKAEAGAGAAPMDVDQEAKEGAAGQAQQQGDSNANGSAGHAGDSSASNGVEPKDTEAGSSSKEAAKEGEQAPRKKVYSKIPLMVEAKTLAWTKSQIDAAVLEESQMANQDRVLRETADKRNELESYIYAMRDKIVSSLKPYVENDEAELLGTRLTAAEDWLYSDEGFDSTKSIYTSKLKELTDMGDPVEARLYESTHRPEAANELRKTIGVYMKFANSTDEAYAHITPEDKDKVREAVKSAEMWLNQKLDQQANVPPSKNPVVTCDEIRKQLATVNSICKPIMKKPKPAPKAAEPAAKEADKGAGAGAKGDSAEGAAAGEKEGGKTEAEGSKDAAGPKTSVEVPEPGVAPTATVDGDASIDGEASAPSKAAASSNDPAPTPMETDEVEQME